LIADIDIRNSCLFSEAYIYFGRRDPEILPFEETNEISRE
jgi:hypothetical protein